MGNWNWEGFNREGKKIRGKLEAGNEVEVKKLLRNQGIRPIRITAPSILEVDLGQWMIEKGLAKPFGVKELTQFTRQLQVMTNAGVPILQALEILFKQEKNPSLKHSIKKIANEVGSGKSLADAMGKQQGFDDLYCNLIAAGEAGGILDEILNKIAAYMERQEALKKQVKSAIRYPAIVAGVGFVVVMGMMMFVVPQFTDMIASSGQEVPAVTAGVMAVSDFIRAYALTLVPFLFILVVVLAQVSKTEQGKPVFDQIMMKIPLIGGVLIKGNLGSFTRTLSTMVGAGVSLIDSLEICRKTIDNVIIQRDIARIRKAVSEGKTLADPISRIEYFPEMVYQMVKIGEQTGELDGMLTKVADLFEQDVADLLDSVTAMIEPIILVVLGGIVGVILIAMYLPIFMQAGGGA